MDTSSQPKRKSKKQKVLNNELSNRLQLIIAFEDDPSNIDHTLSSCSFVDLYSPRTLGSCTLAWHLPSDPLNIQYYRNCLVIPGEVPYFVSPSVGSYLPPEQHNSLVRQPRFTSILPLLLTAQHVGIDIRQYGIISERNSLRRIAMNNENYTIGVVRFGSTIFLRRYDTYETVDKSDIGYRFEQMCTADNYLDGNYLQLIAGQIGSLKTLITGEVDAIERQTRQSIELKCHKKGGHQHQHDWWLQAFLSGTNKVIHGRRADDDPELLINIDVYRVSKMSTGQHKEHTLKFLHQVLQFLLSNVVEGRSYLLSRCTDPTTKKHGLFLYEVVHKQDKEKLTFLTQDLLNRLVVNANV